MTKQNSKLPKGWKYKRLGEMFNFVGGGTPSKTQTDFWNGDLNWASVKDVKGDYLNSTKDFITENGLKNSASNVALKGDVILITRISPGKSIITNIRTAINQDLKIAKPKFKTTSKFIYYFFSAIERDCIKKSSGTTVLGITLNNLNELLIPDLSIEEQNAIVSKIEELFSELDKGIEDLKTAQQQLKTYRQSVLKYAFEGKLTQEWRKENKNIQSATKFLEKISSQRKSNYLKTKNKADKNYDFNYKQSTEIKTWANASLDKLIYIAGRIGWRGLTKAEYKDEGPLFLSVHSLNFGKYVEFKDAFHITKERYLESPEIILMDNDILLCKDGAGIGKIAIINKLPDIGTVNSSLLIIRGLEIFLPEFLYYLFSGPKLQSIVKDRISGSTTPHLFQNDIRKFDLLIPPIEEQHQIVQEIESRLSVADKMEESIAQSLLQAEALRQSILKKAFSGKLI